MGDWMRLTPQEEALVHSRTDAESLVLLDGELTKLPKELVGPMMTDAFRRAIEDALRKLEVAYTLRRGPGAKYGFKFEDGASLSDMAPDFDVESGFACMTVTMADGKKMQGFAKLERLRPT